MIAAEQENEQAVLQIAGRPIGGPHFSLIAGPCTVESREQVLDAAQAVSDAGATMFRGGAYKPRTSPYAFQGLGQEGLRLLAEAKEQTGLPIVTEVMDARDLDAVDPSHAAGRRDLVEPMSLAAAAGGADGIIVEVHPRPEEAICDAAQQLPAAEFADYLERVRAVAAVAGKVLVS